MDNRLNTIKSERNNKKSNTITSQKIKKLIFYIIMLAFPVVQFCVFYVGVNFNSVLLSFQIYDTSTSTFKLAGFTNIQTVLKEFTQNTLINATKNSAVAFLTSIVVGIPLTLFFSYYIYKKFVLNGLFKVVLFMPSIVSSIAMVLMYKYFADLAMPSIFSGIGNDGLLGNSATTFPTVLVYSVYMGFGSGVLLYSGSMNTISDSIVEAASLDGATPAQEFFHITLPMIYPTIVTFMITAIAAFFTNQINLFSFFGPRADPQNYTLGYYLYFKTQLASSGEYPYLAAMGLCMTVIAVPATIVIKQMLEKYGPSVD